MPFLCPDVDKGPDPAIFLEISNKPDKSVDQSLDSLTTTAEIKTAKKRQGMIISGNAQRILKVLHLLTASFWIGGGLSELVLHYTSSTAQNGDELFGILRSFRFISVYVAVYLGAFGTFFTGLAYSLCTNRGFIRHKWIIIKWVSTIYLILCGATYLGPWSVQMLETVQTLGTAAFADANYQLTQERHLLLLSINMALMVILTAISVYKPWETKESIRLLNKKLRVEK